MRAAIDRRQVAFQQASESAIGTEPIEERVEADRIEATDAFLDGAGELDERGIDLAERMPESRHGVGIDVFRVAPGQQLVEDSARLTPPAQLHEARTFERTHPGQTLRDDTTDVVL